MDLHRLRLILNVSRRWTEKNFEKFNFKSSLVGMCAISTNNLSQRLSVYNIRHRIAVTNTHVWIEVGDYALDVTATQFNDDFMGIKYPGRLLVPTKKYKATVCKTANIDLFTLRYFDDRAYFVQHLIKCKWYKDQIPK